MNYLLITSIAFILFSYSNFINLIFRTRLNETFLITICSIIIFNYFLFKLNIYFNLTILDYTFLIILLSAFLFLPIIIKNNSKINKKLNLEFLFIFLLIFILSKDRYYLDQDEFSYWGVALKNLTQNIDGFSFTHHPDGLNLFRNLFIFFEYNEGNIIFSNNLILISGFYYLFYDRKLIFFEKFFLFTIYYLLLNNLSFGFLSIYSDPILSVFYACLLKKTYFMFKDGNSLKEINFLFIFFTLLLINRSAPIYAIFIFYLCFKHSIHYFAFLEASKTETRSVKFIANQFFADFLATFSLMLRFYTLLFRMNVYDNLDDFFDSYYIFVGDFDDDEYLNELFLSIHGTILFTLDNNDDRSFLLEDENDFSNDFFYTYFVLWGKLYLFVFFIAELAARLGLAFYIFYLIIFEVHAVNCSYREDNFLNTKKN